MKKERLWNKEVDLRKTKLTEKSKTRLYESLKKTNPRLLAMRNEYDEITDEILFKMVVSRNYVLGFYDGFMVGKTYFDRAVAIHRETSDYIRKRSTE